MMEHADFDSEQAVSANVAAVRDSLPEYQGLARIENRHASDELLRTHLARLLSDFQQQILSVAMFLAARNQDDLKVEAARLIQRIETLADKIQSAPYAYSPFFTFDRLPEEHQERVIADDQAVLAAAGEIARFAEPTLGEDADFQRLLAVVGKVIVTLDEKIENRLNDIMEFH